MMRRRTMRSITNYDIRLLYISHLVRTIKMHLLPHIYMYSSWTQTAFTDVYILSANQNLPAKFITAIRLGPVTDLRAGAIFNVTWRFGSPTHDGGYMIQILNPNGTINSHLTRNGTNYIGTYDDSERYTERYEVKLPNIECRNCSIRLLRQALENNFYFWTCADVNIKQTGFSESCSSHGRLVNGKCQCGYLYSGPVCQYKDECWKDSDCNNNGRCIDRKSRAHPKKVCYCKKGWFGMSCEKGSPMKDIPASFEGYNHFEARHHISDIFWKILKDEGEIEIIIKMETTSWLAVGWRNIDAPVSCRNFPNHPKQSELPITEYGGTQQRVRQRPQLHPMNCADVVVGYVNGDLSYIHDYYIRGLDTPMLDTFLGGTDDLTAAVGHERSGYTFMGFRKKLLAKEETDNSFSDKDIHVIWARGPQFDKMKLRPEDRNYKKMMLYKPYYTSSNDDVMYHLQDKMYRGFIQLNFFNAWPYKRMNSTTPVPGLDVGAVIRSDTVLGWDLTIGLLFGMLGLLVLVTIILVCSKIDMEKNNKRMEKERQRIALHGEVNVVTMEEYSVTKQPLETTETVAVTVLQDPQPVQAAAPSETKNVSEPIYDNQLESQRVSTPSETKDVSEQISDDKADSASVSSSDSAHSNVVVAVGEVNGVLNMEYVEVEINHNGLDDASLGDGDENELNDIGVEAEAGLEISVQLSVDAEVTNPELTSDTSSDNEEPEEVNLNDADDTSSSDSGSDRDDIIRTEGLGEIDVVATLDECCDSEIDEEANTQM